MTKQLNKKNIITKQKNKTINIGTTFSGVGAVEHALERLKIKNKIIFACDNGGVELFKKNITDRFFEIKKEINYLNKHIDNLSLDSMENYKKELQENLNKIEQNYKTLTKKVQNIELKDKITNVINTLLNVLELKEDRKFNDFYNIKKLDISDYLYLITELKKYLKNEKNIDNELKDLDSIAKNREYRASRREIKDIVKKLLQLHETIRTLEVQDNLEKFKTFEDKKKYVDDLYIKNKKINYVQKSYTHNYKIDAKDFHQNISFLDGTYYKNRIDLYVGGSPCQSFSIVGKRGGFEDTRGTLFYEYIRVLKESEPRFFIYENVKGVINHDRGKTWETMKNTFEETGYKFKDYILNAKNFGIPQHRERLFVNNEC